MSCNELILLGTGGHARVVAELARENKFLINGALDPAREIGSSWEGVKILGDDEVLESISPKQYMLASGIGQLPYNCTRKERYLWCRKMGFSFPTLVHPSAVVSQGAIVKGGVQVMAGAVIQVGASIGENVIINTGVQIDHDCVIHNHVHLAPAVVLCGGVRVGEHAYIGAGTVIAQGVEVGAGAVLAAGSVVLEDVSSRVRLVQKKMNHVVSLDEIEKLV